ncbi:MAG TPA: SH3 domain-containing protein [Bdellovibrionales bacterium]|nr:SH3 domain-containing protein [Bdellovibrionales bacterium]
MENPLHVITPARFFTFIAALALAGPVHAAQKGVVVNDDAMVYRKANFDAPVIGYFKKGRKVTVSTKKSGPFYRVKFKQGLMGYIADTDVSVEGKNERAKGGEAPGRVLKERSKAKLPPWQGWAIGPTFAFIQFTELIAQQELIAKMTAFGAQFSMPFRLLDGPFSLATTFLYHSGAPSYYQQVSSTAPAGSILYLESVLNFPVMNFSGISGAVMLGAGPLLTQTSFQATIGGQPVDLKETKIGISILAGVAYRLGDIIFRGEGKYFVEKASYPGFQATVLYAFK